MRRGCASGKGRGPLRRAQRMQVCKASEDILVDEAIAAGTEAGATSHMIGAREILRANEAGIVEFVPAQAQT